MKTALIRFYITAVYNSDTDFIGLDIIDEV